MVACESQLESSKVEEDARTGSLVVSILAKTNNSRFGYEQPLEQFH
jgi:hypothetical protein